MADYGWNWRHGTGSSGQRRYYGPSQIACRICDHVFMNAQALIDHLQSHLVEYDIASRRRRYGLNLMSSQADPFTDPFTCPTTLPTTLPDSLSGYGFPSIQGNNPVFPSIPPPGMVSLQPTLQPHTSLMDRNTNTILQRQHRPINEPLVTSDCTKPFLQQLEKPFSYGTEFRKRSGCDGDKLDLSLKL